MTELAVRTPEMGAALETQMTYARAVATAQMLPDNYRNKPADILLAVGLGQSMGLSPAESLYRISVIKGKPTASAELVAANVRKAGHRLRVTITPGKASCSIWRSDDPEFEFNVVRDAAWAQAMGLANNDNYKKQGDTMLSWRAITACARLACPEALYGVAYTSDEMFDMDRQRPAPTNVEPTQTSDPDPGAATPAEPPVPSHTGEGEPSGSEPLSTKTRGAMFALMEKVGISDEQDQRDFLTDTLGRTVESRASLTEAEGIAAGKRLRRIEQGDPDADWAPSFDAEVVEP